MDEVLPLELAHTFHCQIISSQLIITFPNTAVYKCATNFGTMTLLVEHLHSDTIFPSYHSNNTCQTIVDCQTIVEQGNLSNPKQLFERRNKFLTQGPFSTFIPVIYEQHIITTHKNRSTCFTLIQPISVVSHETHKDKIHLERQKNLILSLFFLENSTLTLNINRKQQSILFVKSELTGSILINFTQLCFCEKDFKPDSKRQQQITELLSKFYSNNDHKSTGSSRVKEIILIKDQIYGFSDEKLLGRRFKSYFELAVCLNFLSGQEVFLKEKQSSENESKELKQNMKKVNLKSVSSSDSKIPIQFYHSESLQISGQFNFYDNYCIDLLQPIKYEQLVDGFFVDNSFYVLKKSIYLEVERISSSQKQQKGDTIYIEQEVSKSECINFLITYCKFITPTLQKITYQHQLNTLIFQFLGKLKVPRRLKLVFHPNYIVKDQELSMIIEKSKLDKVVVKLSQMLITDSFLMFLANSQKMSKIISLDISYCNKVTQNGVNSLLISPYCKKLEILNVSGTPVTPSSIQSLLSKTKLKELSINHCFSEDFPQDIFLLKSLNLTKLQALGINVSPFFSLNVSILKIDIQVPFDFLKQLKDMPLKQLRIKLVEEKKNFIGGFLGTIGNFYSKEVNPIKIFAEGRPSKTLRQIDLSGSNVKLKNLKHLFSMPQVQIVILEDITAPQQIDFIMSPKILQLSIKNTQINAKELLTLLKSTKIMMRLNVAMSEVRKQQIKELITHTKKYINTLVISDNQYCPDLIDPNGKVSQYVQTFQVMCKRQFFKPRNQKIISAMILKTLKGNKSLKIQSLTETNNYQNQRIVKFNNREFQSIVMKHMRNIISLQRNGSVNNIFINDKPYQIVLKERRKSQDKLGINCEQFIRVHNHNSRKQKVYKLIKNATNLSHQQSTYLKDTDQTFNSQQSSITYFTYVYKKAVIQHPNSQMEVSLVNNKIINCETALKIINDYNPFRQIKMVDMRGATLYNPKLFDKIIEIPHLQSFNHNQYQVVLDGRDFVTLSQKYLKFFMRVSCVRKLKLTCKNIIQVDILFSILFHILDSHYQSIQSLDCTFQNIKMNSQNSFSFWVKISELRKLEYLKLNFINCSTIFLKRIFEEHEWNHNKKLQTLILEGIDCQSLPIIKNETSVKSLSVNMQSSKITESQLIKFLRVFGSSMRKLRLNLSECEGIMHPNRLFVPMQSFKNLQKLSVSFQYCPIKQLSTLDFMENIYSLKHLKQVELDLSYTSIPFGSISNIVGNFPYKLPNCRFVIYSLGQFVDQSRRNESKQVVFDKEGLSNQGVQVLL